MAEKTASSGKWPEYNVNDILYSNNIEVEPVDLLADEFWNQRTTSLNNNKIVHSSPKINEKQISLLPSSEQSGEQLRVSRWFIGTRMLEEVGQTYPYHIRKMAYLNDKIVNKCIDYTSSKKKAYKVVDRLSEWFSRERLDYFTTLIYNAPYRRHFCNAEDLIQLLLAFMSLALKPRHQVISPKVIKEINDCVGLSFKRINNKWFRLIKKYNPIFYHAHTWLNQEKKNKLRNRNHFDHIDHISQIDLTDKEFLREIQKNNPEMFKAILKEKKYGIDPIIFLDSILNTVEQIIIPNEVLTRIMKQKKKLEISNEANKQTTKKILVQRINSRSKAFGKKFCDLKKFKFIKSDTFITWVRAIISKAYFDITEAEGIPFPDLTQEERNYISEQRWKLKSLIDT